MIIRMRQNAQVPAPAFDTVCREITSISRYLVAEPSNEHCPVAHSETRVHRARSRTLILSTSLALVFAGCNVYDASLLEGALGAGGTSIGTSGGSTGMPASRPTTAQTR